MKTTCRISIHSGAERARGLPCSSARCSDSGQQGCFNFSTHNGGAKGNLQGNSIALSDGTRAVPVLLKGGPVHEVFLRKHLGDTPDEFRMRWRKAVFTGQASMLREFSSEVILLQYIASTPGAIGYVSRVGESDAISVKILTTAP